MPVPTVWTERRPGAWTQCTYCAVLECLVAAGHTDFPLGMYQPAERDALESTDDRPDHTGATFNDTDLAIRRRYSVDMMGSGSRMDTRRLRELLTNPGHAVALAGRNTTLPPGAVNWDPGFKGAHAVGMISGPSKVLWLDPLATAGYRGDRVDPDGVLAWAVALNGNSHDPRWLLVDQWVEDDEMAWMSSSKPITATAAALDKGQPIRTDPRMTSSNVSFTLPAPTMISLAFSVEGDAYLGSTLWYGYFLNNGGPRVFHSKQVTQLKSI